MATLAKFVPAFFGELQRNGHLDGAMAAGRRAVRDQTDWWMPVLFTRLSRGLIWYTPGFGEAQRLERWPSLINDIKKGCCTPILGHGLTDSLLGSRRELAQKWAETYHFPMAPYNREDLPQVAQYLAVKQNLSFPRDILISDLHNWLLQQHRANLPQGSHFEGSPTGEDLDQLISAIGARRRESDPNDPFRVLANLSIPVYITASPHHLMLDALKAAGKQPREEFCRWNRQLERLSTLQEKEPDYRPDPANPLIYYIFGRLNESESLVLTEDDYFDFLIGATKKNELIPHVVLRTLADSGLLFLGFQLDDWDFRVLFRRIVDQEGGALRRRHTNVAVQIGPEEGRIMEPEGARRYLESYFDIADISIYWGTADDFAADLLQKMPKPAP
jgi:SIR2-like domain